MKPLLPLLLLFVSCSSSKVSVNGGEYSQKEITYCGGTIKGYFVKVFKKDSRVRPPVLGVWLYTDPVSKTTIINYVINLKEKAHIRFENRSLLSQVEGLDLKQHTMSLQLTIAALSPDNIYSYPDYKITPHNLSLNQWKVYKRGLFGDLFATEYKIVTMPADQHKNISQDEIIEDFDPKIHEGIYVGEGIRIPIGSDRKIKKVKVITPTVLINGVTLPSQSFSFELDIDEFKIDANKRCPSISDVFRWN